MAEYHENILVSFEWFFLLKKNGGINNQFFKKRSDFGVFQ